jgi:ATP-binding cassette subfamily B protein
LILDTPQEVDIDASTEPVRKMKGKIEFRDLHFTYEGNGKEVLRGIDLVIEPGETIGIVGATGCGKTTLISLLARLYQVAPGQIFIDDTDLRDWDVRSLRQQMGFATQEPFLFSDTVEQNILFGTGDSPALPVEQAAEIAALAKDAETFPRGLDTLVGERGITLSGGQKQRTTIARAIITDPAVIVLDDATSSVDTETEDEINRRIKTILTGRTAIIISHRVSSVKEADRIIYLEDGRIGEQGSHGELLALNRRYAELYRAQLLANELEQL